MKPLLLLIVLPLLAVAQQGDPHQHHQHDAPGDAAWAAGPASGQLLEASFELVNGSNELVTEQDFRGRYLLISFGFSSCRTLMASPIRRSLLTVSEEMPWRLESCVRCCWR